MRRLLVLPLLLLVPLACSSDDDGGEPTASGAGGGSFCDQVEDVADAVQASADLGDDPTETVRLLRDVSRRLGEIDPPAAIADAWQLYVDGTADFADALADVEPGDNVGATEALVEFAQTHEAALKEAGRVATYVGDECDVEFQGPLNP